MRARRGNDAEQPGPLQIDTAALGTDAAKKFQAPGNADVFDQKLGERDLTLGRREGSLPHGDGKAAVAVDGTQVEENIDGQ